LILRRITGEARVTRWAAGGGRGRGAVPCKVSELLSLHVCASAVSLALALQMAYQNIKNMATIDTHTQILEIARALCLQLICVSVWERVKILPHSQAGFETITE